MYVPTCRNARAQGLYDLANEHDNCGVGFIANIKGIKSHIVARGIDILCNLTHCGAVGADPPDGDGAGLTIQTPDALFRAIVDFELPPRAITPPVTSSCPKTTLPAKPAKPPPLKPLKNLA